MKEKILNGALFLERIILIPIMLVIFAILVVIAMVGIGLEEFMRCLKHPMNMKFDINEIEL